MQKIDRKIFPVTQLAFLGYDAQTATDFSINKKEDGSLLVTFYNEKGELLRPKPMFTPSEPKDVIDPLGGSYHLLAGAYRELYAQYNKLKLDMHQVSVPVIQSFIVAAANQQEGE